MTLEERDIETADRLARMETKLSHLEWRVGQIDGRLCSIDRKMNFFSGGVMLIGGFIGIFGTKIWDYLFPLK